MNVLRFSDERAMGAEASRLGADVVRQAISERGRAVIIVATGASQFEVLKHLAQEVDIDWGLVTIFHLDEYLGIAADHGASFRRYLQERLMMPLQNQPNFVPVQGDAGDVEAEIQRLNFLIAEEDIDVCFAGIGENCHLAFNDPPANFHISEPYITVVLDEVCRQQQFSEGWFATLDEVPSHAISMSIRQIMKSRCLIVSVPHAHKADAVKHAVQGPVTPEYPASILQQHPNCSLILDSAAAQRLDIDNA